MSPSAQADRIERGGIGGNAPQRRRRGRRGHGRRGRDGAVGVRSAEFAFGIRRAAAQAQALRAR